MTAVETREVARDEADIRLDRWFKRHYPGLSHGRLEKLLRGIRSKVNLIPYNENPDRDIRRPDQERVDAFQTYLVSHGLQCSVRTTRGVDISAACGQLGKGAPGG